MSTELILHPNRDENIPEFAKKLRNLPRDEQIEEAHKMRVQGTGVRTIAKVFGVAPSTVKQWLREFTANYRNDLENSSKVDLVVEILSEYDELKDWFMMQANQSVAINSLQEMFGLVDGTTPKPIMEADVRLRYVQAAAAMLKEKKDLLQKTGIIPSVAEQLHISLSDEKPKSEERIEDGRTQEQLMKDVSALMKTAKAI